MAKVYRLPKQILLILITIYQSLVSPLFGRCCRFYPTCSCYAKMAIEKYGVLRGGFLTIKRLLKCHPYHPGGVDEIP